jgi:hypothetical protein
LIQALVSQFEETEGIDPGVAFADALIVLGQFGVDVPSDWNWQGDLTPRTWAITQASDDQLVQLNEFFGGDVLDRPVSLEAQRRIWSADSGFRLFLSHSSENAAFVGKVKAQLELLGIAGFAAHADIQPPRDWEDEILDALNSCDSLAAFLHTDFHSREWTDHEVGHALGRGVLVIPLMFDGQEPYGFLKKYQGVKAQGLKAFQLAVKILDALAAHETTQVALAPHLVSRFERAEGPDRAVSFLKRIARAPDLPAELLKRLDEAPKTNTHLSDDKVRSAVDALLKRHDYKPESAPWDAFGEQSF